MFDASFRRRFDHDQTVAYPTGGALVAIDVAKTRDEILIKAPGASRRRRLSVPNNRSEHDRPIKLLSDLGRPVTCGFEAAGNYHRPFGWRPLQASSSVRIWLRGSN